MVQLIQEVERESEVREGQRELWQKGVEITCMILNGVQDIVVDSKNKSLVAVTDFLGDQVEEVENWNQVLQASLEKENQDKEGSAGSQQVC